MKEIRIRESESGIRLDKFLDKLLPGAGRSFLYKMLRKKNITLNGKKAEGSERLHAEDQIRIFFSDETYEQFCRSADSGHGKKGLSVAKESIVYENAHLLIVDKPAGLLTQRAGQEDFSLNDWLRRYVSLSGHDEDGQMQQRLCYTPSAVNRLDRNTSGLVLCAKTYEAARALSALIRERKIGKYYLALVKGRITKSQTLNGFFVKDPVHNRVSVSVSNDGTGEAIHTSYTPWSYLDRDDMTLLLVRLITGKSHQIRAHLASVSHPVCGDPKYGDLRLNKSLSAEYGIRRQMLHAFALSFPPYELFLRDTARSELKDAPQEDDGMFLPFGKTIAAPPPQDFMKILRTYHIEIGEERSWQRGIQEDFAVPPWKI